MEEHYARVATEPYRLDTTEAPAGYRAVLKSSIPGDANICNSCDWRKTCNDPATDFLAPGHRCMGYPVVSRLDDKTYARKDGCGVVFKKLP